MHLTRLSARRVSVSLGQPKNKRFFGTAELNLSQRATEKHEVRVVWKSSRPQGETQIQHVPLQRSAL